jgi:glycosyltransferase involved in cell wall biosynthesis
MAVTPMPNLSLSESFDALDIENRPIDVLLLANLGPIDAKSFGYELNSQVEIWNTAIGILSARIESFQNEGADQILTRAQRKSKMRLEDEQLCKTMAQQLSEPAATSLLWRYIAQTLVNNKITFTTAGSNWPDFTGAGAEPAPSTPADRARLISQAKILIHADLTGGGPGNALLAAGLGTAVVARQHPLEHEGGIFSVLEMEKEVAVFLTVRELVQTIRDLLKNPEKRRKMAENAHQRCLSEHRPESRLKQLISIASS